jgi:ABC-type phosphate/phosphonate transport system substrate-binding protein
MWTPRELLSGDYPDIFDVVLQVAVSPPIPNTRFLFSEELSTDARDGVTAALLDIASTPEESELLATCDI